MHISFELPQGTMLVAREDLKAVLKEMLKDFQMEVQDDGIMTIKETAAFLKISIPRVRNLIAKKEIPFFQRGQVIRLYRIDVLEWLRENTVS